MKTQCVLLFVLFLLGGCATFDTTKPYAYDICTIKYKMSCGKEVCLEKQVSIDQWKRDNYPRD